MSFVEVFVNLKLLNLAHNKINKIVGLRYLLQLKSLTLGDNCIEEIEGLSRTLKLR